MSNELAIGFVGFGEAGFHLARGLRVAGVARLFAYDLHTHTPGRGELIRQRAAESEVQLLESNAQLAAAGDLLLSVVTADAAVAAARENAPFLSSRHYYVDLNSVAPATKQTVAEILAPAGAKFVEAAVMAPVPPQGHRVPILLNGPWADALIALLAPFGMRLEALNGAPGAAAAVKLCRSIVIKGLEALLFECVLAAAPYGATERVFASLEESFPGLQWEALAGYMIGRVVIHGERRAREMDEVARMLASIGVKPLLAEATARRQDWGAQLGWRERFGVAEPAGYREVLDLLREPQTPAP